MAIDRPVSYKFHQYAEYFGVSKSSTLVTHEEVRLAGFIPHQLTASFGNTPTLKIINGSASSGAVVIPGISGTSYPRAQMVALPYVRMENGLYLDVSGSATGVSMTLFYLIER